MKKKLFTLMTALSLFGISCQKDLEIEPHSNEIQGQFKVYEIQAQDSIYMTNSQNNQLYFSVDEDTVTKLLWLKQEYQSFAYLRTDGVSFSMLLFAGNYIPPVLDLKNQDTLEFKYCNPADTTEYYLYSAVRTFNTDLDTLQ